MLNKKIILLLLISATMTLIFDRLVNDVKVIKNIIIKIIKITC